MPLATKALSEDMGIEYDTVTARRNGTADAEVGEWNVLGVVAAAAAGDPAGDTHDGTEAEVDTEPGDAQIPSLTIDLMAIGLPVATGEDSTADRLPTGNLSATPSRARGRALATSAIWWDRKRAQQLPN